MTLLTPSEIREQYAAGGVTQEELGRKYHISQPHIGKIVRGAVWVGTSADERARMLRGAA